MDKKKIVAALFSDVPTPSFSMLTLYAVLASTAAQGVPHYQPPAEHRLPEDHAEEQHERTPIQRARANAMVTTTQTVMPTVRIAFGDWGAR